MYKDFAETAKKEGFTKISKLFEMVGKIESHHEERFNKLLEKVKEEKVFKSEAPKMWVCRNCGHVHYGEEAPKICRKKSTRTWKTKKSLIGFFIYVFH